MRIFAACILMMMLTPTFASPEVEIRFRKVKDELGNKVYCPQDMRSKRNGNEEYCKASNGLVQGDAICVYPGDKVDDKFEITFVKKHVLNRPEYKFKVEAKENDSINCDSTDFEFSQRCDVADDGDGVVEYKIYTQYCEYDPRVIISGGTLTD